MPPISKSSSRAVQACDNCRRRKTKCDGERPSCCFCAKHNVQCTWPTSSSLLYGSYRLATSESKPESTRRTERSTATPTIEQASIWDIEQLESPFGLPPRYILQRLLEIFFQRHHQVHFCCFLNRSSFEIKNLHEQSPFLLTSIVALASLDLNDEEVKRGTKEITAQILFDYYLSRARQFSRDLSDEPTIPSSQANLILALCEVVTRQGRSAWMHAGLAIRMAQALRLGKEFAPDHSPREKEIRRRTYWACFVMDRLLAYASARPQTLLLSETGIHLPCPEPSFAFDETYDGASITQFISHMNANSSVIQGILPFFIASMTLWGNLAATFEKGRRFIPFPPSDPSSPFFQGVRDLEQWFERLPPRFRWSSENYALHRSLGDENVFINMSFMLQHAICVSHQEYLPQHDIPGIFVQDDLYLETICDKAGLPLDYRDDELISTCVNSATAIVEMAKILLESDESNRKILPSSFMGGALTTACAVYLWVYYIPGELVRQDFDTAKTQADIDFIMEKIQTWGKQWEIAGAWTDILRMLHKLYSLAYGGPPGWGLNMHDLSSITSPQPSPFGNRLSVSTKKDNVICLPPAERLHQTMYDKVRNISRSALEDVEEKKKQLTVFLRTLWQHTSATNLPDVLGGIGNI